MATLKRFNSDEDAGMRMADDALQDLETRLNKVYAQAAAELTQSLDAYMAPFEALDEEMRGRFERGEITETEYITWRRNRILRTEQMHAQIESLTNDMVNADKIAVAMINDELPGVYCSGYNFAGFKGEMMAQAAGYNYASFSIYNTEAMRIILTENPDLIPWQPPEVNIPADMRWNRKHIQNAIAQGILQGESIPKISNRLLPLVNMDRTAATRTARTSFTAVQNEGRRDATKKIQDAGIPMQEPWMALMADNTRDTHLMLHGTLPNEKGLYGEGIIPTGNLLRFPADPKGDPEQIYNCRCRVNSFLPGIDHSRDDELYEKMMREEFYDDWVGDKDAPGVMEYKVDEQRRALERKRQLESGEIKPKGTKKVVEDPVNPAWRVATTRAEAKDILANDLGFKSISSGVNKFPDDVFIDNVNQLSKLDARFKVFGKYTDNVMLETGGMDAWAKARASYLRSDGTMVKQAIKLNTSVYTNPNMGKKVRNTVNSGWWMPISDDYLTTSTITHEYGHLLEYNIIYGEVGGYNGQTWAIYENLYRVEIQQIAREITTENSLFFDVDNYISEYGKKNSKEFFAECFMNSQCEEPNILGKAMNEWLKRRGY